MTAELRRNLNSVEGRATVPLPVQRAPHDAVPQPSPERLRRRHRYVAEMAAVDVGAVVAAAFLYRLCVPPRANRSSWRAHP
jgi:hypothetical protein